MKCKPYAGFEEDVRNLYGIHATIYGPYKRKQDSRRIVLISGVTKMYAKVKLEIKLGRILSSDETVDHKDENRLNDKFENLQLLTRQANSRKASKGNTYALGYKQTEVQKRSGDKNGQALISNAQVLDFRIKFKKGEISRKDISNKTGLKERSVRNMLLGISYKQAKGPLAVFNVGRPRRA